MVRVWGGKERRQLIPIKESTVKESQGSRKVFKERETCNVQIEYKEYVLMTKIKLKVKKEVKNNN